MWKRENLVVKLGISQTCFLGKVKRCSSFWDFDSMGFTTATDTITAQPKFAFFDI